MEQALSQPPKPRLALRVGVIGHRPNRLQASDTAALTELLNKTLITIADGVQALAHDDGMAEFYSDATPQIRVVTGIAYGIDEMAMKSVAFLRDSATTHDDTPQAYVKPTEWQLELVAPAPINVCAAYAWGDRPDKKSDLDTQLASYLARWRWVQETANAVAELPIVWAHNQASTRPMLPETLLDALFASEAERLSATWGADRDYEISHTPAAEFLLRNIDLLVAFWDGGQSAGAGGTVDIIERAHVNSVPVILFKLDQTDTAPRRLVSFQREDLRQEIVGWKRPIGQLELTEATIFEAPASAFLKPLFMPPTKSLHEANCGLQDEHYQEERESYDHLSAATYFSEQLTAFDTSRTYDRFLDFWFGRRALVVNVAVKAVFCRISNVLRIIKALKGNATRQQIDAGYRLNPRLQKDRMHWSEQAWATFLRNLPIASEQAQKIKETLHARFIVADVLAVDYANRYRSSVISSYLLSTLAVTLAIIGLAFAGESKVLKAFLLAAEFGIITWILALVAASKRDQHHSKLVNYRRLAESLRHMLFLAGIGEYPSPGRRGQSWVGWYVLATARELGMPSGQFTPDSLAKTIASVSVAEVVPQMDYHEGTAKKLFHVNHQLHHFGDSLFGATLASVALSGMLILGYFVYPLPAWTIGLKITGCAAAILPAVGAALTGIRYALDLETKAERHAEMADLLRHLNDEFSKAEAEPRWSSTRDALGSLEELLIKDINLFQSNYARRVLTVPA